MSNRDIKAEDSQQSVNELINEIKRTKVELQNKLVKHASPPGKTLPDDMHWIGLWDDDGAMIGNGFIDGKAWLANTEEMANAIEEWRREAGIRVKKVARKNLPPHLSISGTTGTANGKRMSIELPYDFRGIPFEHFVDEEFERLRDSWVHPVEAFRRLSSKINEKGSLFTHDIGQVHPEDGSDGTYKSLQLPVTPTIVALTHMFRISDAIDWFPWRFGYSVLFNARDIFVAELGKELHWFSEVYSLSVGQQRSQKIRDAEDTLESFQKRLQRASTQILEVGSDVGWISYQESQYRSPIANFLMEPTSKDSIRHSYFFEFPQHLILADKFLALREYVNQMDEMLTSILFALRLADESKMGPPSKGMREDFVHRMADFFDFFSGWWRREHSFYDYMEQRRVFIRACIDFAQIDYRDEGRLEKDIPACPKGIREDIREGQKSSKKR